MSKLSDLTIFFKATIKDALKLLDKNASKVVFVVNKQKELIGSLTDGDIRRWILSNGSLQVYVEKVMNKNPVIFSEGTDHLFIKEAMQKRKIECVPIVNSAKKLVDVIFGSALPVKGKIASGELRNISVVIMAGGMGTRLKPFTNILPKPLIPLGDKTILEEIMIRYARFGVKQFHLSINYKAEMIKAYFIGQKNPFIINYVQEKKPLGTGGSVKLLSNKIKGSFFISNCDTIVDADYGDIYRFHRKNKNAITLVCAIKHFPIPYGIVELENGGMMKAIKEKPELDFLVNTGMYVLDSKYLHMIPANAFYHITNLIEDLKKFNEKIGVYPVSSNSWFDFGEWETYQAGVDHFKQHFE
jgi:dTDP-glucose pyrophosphorylase